MNLDKVISKIKRNTISNKKLSKRELIKKKFSYKKDSLNLFIIFPPWGEKIILNKIIKKKLTKDNYSILEYEFPKAMLSTNYKFTKNHFNEIKKQTLKDIKQLKLKYKFKEVKIIGFSIGCVNACMVANNNKDINELFLIVPGHCLAESMWKSIMTKKIRENYEKQKISLKKLKKYWKSLAPENNINKLKVKKISIYLDKSDKIIPFYCGKKLLDQLKSLKYNLDYYSNKNGHILTMTKFYLTPKI